MSSYYKRIKGRNYDREILEHADGSVEGKGDGRISLSDARALLTLVKDADSYTDIEKRTIKYVRDNYKFTPEADAWFRKEIRGWAAKRGAAAKTASGKKTTAGRSSPTARSSRASTRKKAIPAGAAVEESPLESEDRPSPPPTNGEPSSARKITAFIIILAVSIALFIFVRRHSKNNPPATKTKTAPGLTGKKSQAPVIAPVLKTTVLYFQLASSELDPDSLAKLLAISRRLKKHPSRKLLVIGHTCDLGKEARNIQLSLVRARHAARILVKNGIAEDRLIIKGRGSKTPAVENIDERRRRLNRRVELIPQ